MRTGGGRRALVVLAALGLALAGCGGDDPTFLPGVDDGTDPAPEGPPPELAITPADGATDALISTEIGIDTDGEVTEVRLVDAAGNQVGGELREDASSWVPERPLDPTTEYTASVTAATEAGATASAETTFTTMAAPGSRTGTGLYLFDDREYGVAMPVVVEFVQPIPEDARAEVQQRMFVRTDPAQPGVWHWVPDGSQAFYRAKDYWQPGTTLEVRIALDGHPTGEGRYGDQDRSATATIGRQLELEVDNESKQMYVYEEGDLIRTIPVSLGKPNGRARAITCRAE